MSLLSCSFRSFSMAFLCFWLLTIQTSCSQSSSQQRTVFIYKGPGVSEESFEQIECAIRRKLSDSYAVEPISPTQVIDDRWEEKSALFIIPGGADIP